MRTLPWHHRFGVILLTSILVTQAHAGGIGISTQGESTDTVLVNCVGGDPFAATTTIRFDLPQPETVRLEVFDLSGRRVVKLRDAWTPAGRHSLDWNLGDANGAPVRPGAYVCRLTAGSFRAHRKLVVLP